MSKSQRSLCVSFSRTGARLGIYHLFVWSNLNFLHISQWITLPTQSCLVLYPFCTNLLHLLMWLIVSSLSPHSRDLLFCWELSILGLIIIIIIIITNPSARAGYDTRSIFKRSLTDLNSEIIIIIIIHRILSYFYKYCGNLGLFYYELYNLINYEMILIFRTIQIITYLNTLYMCECVCLCVCICVSMWEK